MENEVVYPTRIIDSDNVLAYLAIENPESNVSDFIDTEILAVENEIESYCLQPIIPTDITVTFDGNGSNYMMLREFPVLELKSLKFYADPLINATDYTVDTDCKLLKKESVYYIYFQNGFETGGLYEAVYTVGYEIIPNVISNIGTEMVATKILESNILGNKAGGRLGIQTANTSDLQGFGNANITYKDLLPRWHKALRRFIRPNH